MSKSLRMTLPLLAVATVLVGWSIRSAMAQGAAKGKVTVTVKTAEGTPAAEFPVSLFKGNVPMPQGFGRRGGGDGGGAPASQPATPPEPLKTGMTNAQGMFTFEDVDAGEITVWAGRAGGRRGQGGGGAGAPGGGAPGGGAAGGPPAGGARGRGEKTGTVKAGEELKLDIQLQAGRGGGAGGGRRNGGGGGGAGGAGGQ